MDTSGFVCTMELLEYGFRVEIISIKEKTVTFIHDRMKKEVSP